MRRSFKGVRISQTVAIRLKEVRIPPLPLGISPADYAPMYQRGGELSISRKIRKFILSRRAFIGSSMRRCTTGAKISQTGEICLRNAQVPPLSLGSHRIKHAPMYHGMKIYQTATICLKMCKFTPCRNAMFRSSMRRCVNGGADISKSYNLTDRGANPFLATSHGFDQARTDVSRNRGYLQQLQVA